MVSAWSPHGHRMVSAFACEATAPQEAILSERAELEDAAELISTQRAELQAETSQSVETSSNRYELLCWL
eukprot:Skav203185  [mRNA]  locus=scaffold39:330517:330726:+ [translate_table: standard]